MLGALQRIGRMQLAPACVSSMYSQITLLSNSATSPFSVVDHQHRHLAERREFQKPVGLVGEIDVDPLERHALLVQRDHGALHIGAKLVADEFQ